MIYYRGQTMFSFGALGKKWGDGDPTTSPAYIRHTEIHFDGT